MTDPQEQTNQADQGGNAQGFMGRHGSMLIVLVFFIALGLLLALG